VRIDRVKADKKGVTVTYTDAKAGSRRSPATG